MLGPPHLVAPDVPVVHEVCHRDHGAGESAYESLSADDGEEAEGQSRSEESILEPSDLVLLDEAVVAFQIAFRSWGNVRIVNQPVAELALLSPRGTNLSGRLLEECLLRLA